jgi:2-polyprenyl-3-methyl-5-hydroxy-6-metoxy-1,4-benzoquinol methylase
MNRPDILLSLSWATGKLSHIDPYLPAQGRILDIGSGRGLITAELRTRGYEVTPLDVRDRSAQPAVRPRLYDGGTIP